MRLRETFWIRLSLELALCLVLGLVSFKSLAQNQDTCSVCGAPFRAGNKVFKHARGLVCEACAHYPAQCSICRYPTRADFGKTTDGRYICKYDLPDAVLADDEAKKVYAEASDAVRRLARGKMELRAPNVAVRLFDVDYWSKEDRSGMHKLGFSQTRKVGDEYNHLVIMLSGQLRNKLLAVSAHEFAHLWMHENVSRDRENAMEPESIEAFCELLAYKIILQRGDTNVLNSIVANQYTKGRIRDFIDAEARLGLDAVLEWARNGTTRTLDWKNPDTQQGEVRVETPVMIPSLVVRAPDKLLLRGILGGPSKRMALINDRTFEKGDEFDVKVADKKIFVRCVSITESEVVVEVGTEKVRQTLILGAK